MQAFKDQNVARSRGLDLAVSTKVAIEVCNFLRGKELEKALAILNRVVDKEQAIPFKRFTDGVGHKPGKIGAGRYPVKAAKEFIKLLNNAKANATTKGMTGTLVVSHIAANKASRPVRNRTKYRGEFKRTHVEIIITERKEKPKAQKQKAAPAAKPAAKPAPKEAPKAEEKPKAEPKKEEPKPEVKEAPKAAPEEKPEPKKEAPAPEAKE